MRIKILSPDMASKIAAGEVVERPASVLKELLENSIDAQATQIDITIQRGGIQLIEIRDNGKGIVKEDLALALMQHATSKISNAQDLACIQSLGFRGEALASINAVAKVHITSKTAEQEQAWSISNDNLSVAAHPQGTTITMRDLFYNIPARRKFLRSERTEHQHLEEVFRRIALSNFAVGFSLKTHDKLIKKVLVCQDEAARTRRLVNLCGQQVMNNAIRIDAEQNGLRLWGWLGSVEEARSQEPHQYFFINQRVIRDRLINHAIRQVYQPLCHDGKMPFYCLYLELDPVALDVNVHPTKHEVRFRDVRIIHAFLTQTLSDALGTTRAVDPSYTAENYTHNSVYNPKLPDKDIIGIFANRIILVNRQQKLLLLDALEVRKQILLHSLNKNCNAEPLSNPLIAKLPVNIEYDQKFARWCESFGINLSQSGQASAIIRGLPRILHLEKIDVNILLNKLYFLFIKHENKTAVHSAIIESIDFSGDLSISKAQDLLANIHDLPNHNSSREFDMDELYSLINYL